MNQNPYDIPSLDIEIGQEEQKPKKINWLLLVFAILMMAATFALNLLGGFTAPQYLNPVQQTAYLESYMYAPIIVPFLILVFTQVFKVCRNNPARVKILFAVCLFFFIGSLSKLINHGA